MFRHRGKSRTLRHNLRIASLLSFVAGMVNVSGFFAVQRLTTNVTGHFAFFIDEVFKLEPWQAFVYFLYIFFFFAGSFISNFLIEVISLKKEKFTYVIPASIECLILFATGLSTQQSTTQYPVLIACSLLFAMGLQNSLVTKISSASVRTTHLTGLFTDLGIDLSQLFFYRGAAHKKKLRSSIKLRVTIIIFFFVGGILGAILYPRMKIHTLIFTSALLMLGLIWDNIKFRILLVKRKTKKVRSADLTH